VFWPFTPHSAFRIGVAELGGQLTIVGFEAGGGIVALDRDCDPLPASLGGSKASPERFVGFPLGRAHLIY